MKKLLFILTLVNGVAYATTVSTIPPDLSPLVQQAQAAKLSAEILTRSHYKKVPLDDALSAKIYEIGRAHV